MLPLFIITPPGLEKVCLDELSGLGLEGRPMGAGGISLSARFPDLLRMNLLLRTASRILLQLGEGPASAPETVFRGVDFGPVLGQTARYSVDVVGGAGKTARFVRTAEKEISRQLPRASLVAKGGEQSLRLRVDRGRLQIRIDSSGEHLHRRGYRVETGAAPLRENLAAGILGLAGWDGSAPLLDPMCGSGTFLIEGALLALRRGPGMARHFACEAWPSCPDGLAASLREELRSLERPAPAASIRGSDIRAGALGVTRRNATRAGVLPFLSLERRDAADIAPEDSRPGLVVANPPYGRRVGEREELGKVYRGLGAALRSNFSGWTTAILLADPHLGAALSLPEPQAIPLRNGGLPCTLLISHLP